MADIVHGDVVLQVEFHITMATQSKQGRIGLGVRPLAVDIAHQRHCAGHKVLRLPFMCHQVVVHGFGAGIEDEVVDHRRLHATLEEGIAFPVRCV